jgi:hypothetical protein
VRNGVLGVAQNNYCRADTRRLLFQNGVVLLGQWCSDLTGFDTIKIEWLRRANAAGAMLSGVLPEEGSPPPSSTPDIIFHEAALTGGLVLLMDWFLKTGRFDGGKNGKIRMTKFEIRMKSNAQMTE